MPLQNRVNPFGTVEIDRHRGLFMGNRGGCFHRADQTLKPTHWTSLRWIICRLEFKNRKRRLMQPGRYTELFFLDEATALSAGHRPCYECRRNDALAFRTALDAAGIVSMSDKVDRVDALIARQTRAVLKGQAERPRVPPHTLPDGAFYARGQHAYLKYFDMAFAWSYAGYAAPEPLHEDGVRLTPDITCIALKHGYTPTLHPTLQHSNR